MMRANVSKQSGTAIIVALFVTALVATLAVVMLDRFQIDLRRTTLLLNTNQANLAAQGSLAWGMDQLNNNWTLQMPGRLVDTIPIHMTSKQQNAVITTTIEDAQAYFNVNNLMDASYAPHFRRLLTTVAPTLDEATAKTITDALTDWIKTGAKSSPFDAFYAKQKPPYQAAHQLMVSASELRLVKGMSAALYNQLAPYIIALPESTPININSAQAPVLMSLSTTMTLPTAKGIELYRQKNPFLSVSQFEQFDSVKNNPIAENKITVTSNYFLIRTNVTIGQQEILINTLVNRITQDKKSSIIVLWQTKGTL